MSELSREAQAIIDAARDADAPTTADRARVRAALAAKIGAPAVGADAAASAGGNAGPSGLMNASDAPVGATSVPATTASGAGKGALAAKFLVGALVIGGLGIGGYFLLGSEQDDVARASTDAPAVSVVTKLPAPSAAATTVEPSAPAVSAEPANADEAVAEEAPESAAQTEPEPRAASKRERRANRHRPAATNGHSSKAVPAATSTDSLANLREEKKIISKAKEVLEAGNPSLAMKVLERHAARFPDGVLAQERAGLRILALCDLGEIERARAEAERFLERWPRASMAHRVRTACAQQ